MMRAQTLFAVAIGFGLLGDRSSVFAASAPPPYRPLPPRPVCQSDPNISGGVVGEVVRNPDPSFVSTIIVLPASKEADTYISRLGSTPMSRSFVGELPGGLTGLRRMMSGGTSTIVAPDGHFVCYGLPVGKYTLLATMLQKSPSGGHPHITYLASRVRVVSAVPLGSRTRIAPVTAPPFSIVGHTP